MKILLKEYDVLGIKKDYSNYSLKDIPVIEFGETVLIIQGKLSYKIDMQADGMFCINYGERISYDYKDFHIALVSAISKFWLCYNLEQGLL